METSRAVPTGAIDASEFASIARTAGPFLSVHLSTEGAVENAAQRDVAEWRRFRDRLSEVPANALAAVDPLIPSAHTKGRGLVAIETRDGPLHVEYGPEPPEPAGVWWDPVPRLAPLVRWRQSFPPHLVVLTDRTGADVFGFRYGTPAIEDEVLGEHDELRKVAPGGWSQHRYQARAEDSWEHNAEQVAKEVAEVADRVRPRLTMIAGDVRAVSLVRASLPAVMQHTVRVVPGERPRPAKPTLPPDVGPLVDEEVRREGEDLLAMFDEERAQADRAVDGLAPTVRALEMGQVAVLLLADDPDDRTLWFGPEPTAIGTSAHELHDLGVPEPLEGRATDVLIRAAIGSGAAIRLLDARPASVPGPPDLEGTAPAPEVGRPEGPREGVGALLRWAA